MAIIEMRTRRRVPMTLVVGVALAALIGSGWRWASPDEAEVTMPIREAAWASANAEYAPEPSTIELASKEVVAPTPVQTWQQPPDTSPTVAVPYRFVGRMTVDGESILVFFGRGRTVTLREPGPLDAEFVVDAILEQQVLLRHVPSSVGQFIELVVRQPNSQLLPSVDSFPQD